MGTWLQWQGLGGAGRQGGCECVQHAWAAGTRVPHTRAMTPGSISLSCHQKRRIAAAACSSRLQPPRNTRPAAAPQQSLPHPRTSR